MHARRQDDVAATSELYVEPGAELVGPVAQRASRSQVEEVLSTAASEGPEGRR